MKKFYDTNDIYELIHNGTYQIPDNINNIKIDVGLAGDACNSAAWLSNKEDRFVIGIEPLDYHWKHINLLGSPDFNSDIFKHPKHKILQLHNNSVSLNRNKILDIDNRFCGIKCAIDNVQEICEKNFYEMDRKFGQSGSSSLLPPSNEHPAKLNDVIKVKTISLEMILKNIPWEKFNFIEHLKTDCEGKDFDVVKSCGKFLEKIVFITSEMTNNTHHVINACDPNDFIIYMQKNDFSIINHIGGNINFINNKYLNTELIKTLDNYTLCH